jgi:acyl-CoA carboxylase subunit alpha
MFSSVLVANRGEIARRIFRTARSLGLATVAVHSTADAGSPHVADADAAVHLPGNTAGETYLRGELIVEAALRAGADAIHPGYGFLSENAGFAQAVIDAGLTWIGPPVDAISSMGSKIEAKKLMSAAGVPVLAELTPAEVSADDLPVLVKASAGGGGRGMRVVRRLADLAGELEAARSEAASAFGDGAVFCEPYLENGRHVEVQVLADAHGTVWAVGERECSIQRRHQKVIEEAPSPLVERLPATRAELFEAARKAAAAIGYVGAGTVEFLADDNGRFYFLEMNTRLQVEHPVTELTTGLDLVALQLSIAEGHPLPEAPPESHGHAIEARLYAEDPANHWQPQSGPLHTFAVPHRSLGAPNPRERARVRVDSGVESGSVVTVHYDPMLAKVICWAPDRATAARRLAATLAEARIHGVRTNRDLLVRVLRHPAFLAGQTDTAFFDRHGPDELARPLADENAERLAALAAALVRAAEDRRDAAVLNRLPIGWRNVVSAPQRAAFTGTHGVHEIEYRLARDGLVADGNVVLVELAPEYAVLEADGVRRRFEVASYDGLVCVDSALGPVSLTPVERFADPSAQVAAGSLLAPMPGTVTRVAVGEGDRVAEGQPLLWMEAMKMEHTIAAPAAGVVTELPVSAGEQVEVGAVLAVVKEEAGR